MFIRGIAYWKLPFATFWLSHLFLIPLTPLLIFGSFMMPMWDRMHFKLWASVWAAQSRRPEKGFIWRRALSSSMKQKLTAVLQLMRHSPFSLTKAQTEVTVIHILPSFPACIKGKCAKIRTVWVPTRTWDADMSFISVILKKGAIL